MYPETLTALAAALERAVGVTPVKGRPRLGNPALALPCVALLADKLPEPPTRNGAASGTGALDWTVTVFAAGEAEALALVETLLAWLAHCPTLIVTGRRVTVKRAGSGERQPNEDGLEELEHAFSVPVTTHW